MKLSNRFWGVRHAPMGGSWAGSAARASRSSHRTWFVDPMEPKRLLVIGLCVAAAIVALAAPWRYVLIEPFCVFDPCGAPYVATTPGYSMGGFALAVLAGAAALVAGFVSRVRGVKLGAGALLVGATLVGAFAPEGFAIIVFGEYLGPAWGAVLSALLSLAALVVVASMEENEGVTAPSAPASRPLP